MKPNTRTLAITTVGPKRHGKTHTPKIQTYSHGVGKVSGQEPRFSVSAWTDKVIVRLEMSKDEALELANYIIVNAEKY